MRYQQLQNTKPGETQASLEFVTWQKDMHKCERDMYLSLSSILAVILVYTVVHWTHKYEAFMAYKIREEDKKK